MSAASARSRGVHALAGGWLFGEYVAGAESPDFPETGMEPVVLPHVVAPLSWGDWDPDSWERRWVYRRRLRVAGETARTEEAEMGPRSGEAGTRTFLDFEAVMVSAAVFCNGRRLAVHEGGYLPFSVELTGALRPGENLIAVLVDGRPGNVPPVAAPARSGAIDYLQPAGIWGGVSLRVVPATHIADVHPRPRDVLVAPALDVDVTVRCGARPGPVGIEVALLDGTRTLARAERELAAVPRGELVVTLTLPELGEVELWSPENPALYAVRVSLRDGDAEDVLNTRTGFREAVFTEAGLLLNGRPRRLFGLNRHGLYPHLGLAAPRRLQRRDAEILRRELSCTMVRCSHSPPSPWFLDACDELGLMAWVETPGWQLVGDADFRERVAEDVADMIRRDRARPSVIAWGTRLNESPPHAPLDAATGRVAAALDPTRATAAAMDRRTPRRFRQDLYGYDDYHSQDGRGERATLLAPLPGRPYLVSEAVGALSGAPRYRRGEPGGALALQGRMHAEVHAIAASTPGCAGLLGWCAFDYASHNGGERIWHALKTPGVADAFRIPKPAAGFYASQAARTPMIAPAFSWDPPPAPPPVAPGEDLIVFTNCEELRLHLGEDGTPWARARPDRDRFPGLDHPPVLLELPELDPAARPALRIEGWIGGALVAELRMSPRREDDVLGLELEDPEILADGVDATRFRLAVLDAHGNHRRLAPDSDLRARLSVEGPVALIAEDPCRLGLLGGVAGGYLRSLPDRPGEARLTAEVPGYPSQTAQLRTVAGAGPVLASGRALPRVLNGPAPAVPDARARTLARRRDLLGWWFWPVR